MFRRCAKCRRSPEAHAKAGCDGKKSSWAFQVDVASGVEGRRRQALRSGFGSRAEATEALNKLLHDQRSGTYVERSSLTLGRYLPDWLAARKDKVRESTWASYRLHIEQHISPALGAAPLQALTRAAIQAFYVQLREQGSPGGRGPLSAKSVHNVHLTLSKALADAVEERLIEHNPAQGAHSLKADDRPEMRVWSPDQISVFLRFVAGDRLEALWRLAAATGMRRGELLGLRWADLNLEGASLAIRQTRVKGANGATFGKPKTRKSRRTLGLDATTIAMLKQHRRQQIQEQLSAGAAYYDQGLVFSRPDGAAIDPDSLTGRFEVLCRQADLPRIRLHDLRHSYATAALQAGISIKVLSDRLGHSSVAFTLDTYGHVLPNMDQEAAEKVARLFDA